MVVILFILGLVIGSFLNVCIYRLPREESIVFRSSHCPGCNKKLGVMELIPLLSYFLLKGKCRSCGEKISFRYPLVEFLTGLLFVVTYLSTGMDILLVKNLFLFSLLLVIIFIDLDYQIIPNTLVLIFFLWSLLWQIFYPEIPWGDAFLGAALGGGLLLALAIISKGGMGGGDIKLMFAAGFYLGGAMTAVALFVGFFSGALVGIVLMVLKLKTRKDYIPFGPFLSGGIMVAYLWGPLLVEGYLRLTGLQ